METSAVRTQWCRVSIMQLRYSILIRRPLAPERHTLLPDAPRVTQPIPEPSTLPPPTPAPEENKAACNECKNQNSTNSHEDADDEDKDEEILI